MTEPSPLFSAQVILFPISGNNTNKPVTAKNIKLFLPDKKAAVEASLSFRELGFSIGPLVGTGFSITAADAVFEKNFGIHITREQHRIVVRTNQAVITSHLPIDPLPEKLRGLVQEIVLPPPPAFGPASY